MGLLEFDKEYRIHVYETGPDGRLNLHSLFNYLQDIASDHAVKLGFGRDDLIRKNRIWVLSGMYAEISELPSWEDTILVKTLPYGTEKLFALRNYEVKFRDGRHIASASSSWLILDQTSRKVQRPDSVLSSYNTSQDINKSEIRHAYKLDPSSESGSISPHFRIRISDLDVNRHTNNVMYLKWACDTYNLDFIMKNHPQSVEINYLAESVFDEDISIRTSIEKESFYNHSIVRISDNKELCRIRIGWKIDNDN